MLLGGKYHTLLLIPANCQRRIEWLLISNLHLCNGPALLVLSTSLIRKTPLKTSKKVSHPFQHCFLFSLPGAESAWHSAGNTVWFCGKICSDEQRTLHYSSDFYCVFIKLCNNVWFPKCYIINSLYYVLYTMNITLFFTFYSLKLLG